MIPNPNRDLHKHKVLFMSGQVRHVGKSGVPGLTIEYLIDHEQGTLPTDSDGFYMIPVPEWSCITIAPILELGVNAVPAFHQICPAEQDVVSLDFKLSSAVQEN